MNIKNDVPENKFDMDAIEHLKTLPFDAVRADISLLLEWLQDMNWPVAYYVANYLIPHINEIAKEQLFILETDDGMWKYWIINSLIAHSPDKLSPELIEAIKKIAEHPSGIEVEDTVDEVAKDVLANKLLCG